MALKAHSNFDRDIVETRLTDDQSDAEFSLRVELSFNRTLLRIGWTDPLANCRMTAEWVDDAHAYVNPKQWRERLNAVRATDRLSSRNVNQLVASIVAFRKNIIPETTP